MKCAVNQVATRCDFCILRPEGTYYTRVIPSLDSGIVDYRSYIRCLLVDVRKCVYATLQFSLVSSLD